MTAGREELLQLRIVLHERGPAPCQVAADPERWFAGGVEMHPDQADALCSNCPATAACLAYALAAGEGTGVSGGRTTQQRREMATA